MATGTQDDEQLEDHRATYGHFLGWLKWAVILLPALLILLAIFLVR